MPTTFRGSNPVYAIVIISIIGTIICWRTGQGLWLTLLAGLFVMTLLYGSRIEYSHYFVLNEKDSLMVRNQLRPYYSKAYKIADIREIKIFEGRDNHVEINGDRYYCKDLTLKHLELLKYHLEQLRLRVFTNLERYDKF